MKDEPGKQAIRSLQTLIARETGKTLDQHAQREMLAIVRRALGLEGEAGGLNHPFVRREVTILIADLRGFTAITSTLPTETVIGMLNRCLGKMNEVVSSYNGVVDKFMGDSIMVLFGAPQEHPDDVKRALSCAIEMQLVMSDINQQNQQDGIPELFMGIGINTGSVMAGQLGSHFYSEYTVIGEEVNLASRIESFSLRGQILIGENTFDRCRDFVTTGEAMEVFVKGKPQPVRLRELFAIPSLGLAVKRVEMRRSHRLLVNLPCSCQVVTNKIVMPKKISGSIRDMGYHGMLFETDLELKRHDELKLDFDIPLMDFSVTDVYAKVIQCSRNKDHYLAGIEFTSISTDANMKIQLFVQLLAIAEQEYGVGLNGI
ncbi:MAG: adenylate/guanylate cyclase domain-containing protein [Gallionella sp.]|nr:adenylate/guanylate cyclase domain-containing protein [Gallionella sp.]MDD4947226.1 adenylate/guanylate cyclase domain-containing protein [Gallionella sp.]MDD5612425.1 adenylate/guanylate cyclase domain-containing protein [Gallionella sp.]